MKDLKNAVKMFKVAEKDFKALKNMTDESLFDIEIFGFHAQQTVEKLLKAWLSAIGVKYEKTHDLQILFSLLKANGQNIPAELETLEILTDFSVNFRYDVFENVDASLERNETIKLIQQLKDLVNKYIS
jgi:HEPN domain-containing protein|uniref:HEPN domain-containing protein n=1 Tax=Ignavibacterium album TaxID=591197 RepID=A0A832D0T5_9BACT